MQYTYKSLSTYKLRMRQEGKKRYILIKRVNKAVKIDKQCIHEMNEDTECSIKEDVNHSMQEEQKWGGKVSS